MPTGYADNAAGQCPLWVILDRGHHGGKSLDVRSTFNSDRVFSSLAAVAMGHKEKFGDALCLSVWQARFAEAMR
jgi:hypothetical protein